MKTKKSLGNLTTSSLSRPCHVQRIQTSPFVNNNEILCLYAFIFLYFSDFVLGRFEILYETDSNQKQR